MTTESKARELKPCPFCGSAVALENYAIEAAIRCEECRAGINYRHAPRGPDSETHERLRAAWNTRAQPVVDEAMVVAALCAPYKEGSVSDMLLGGGDEEVPIMRAAIRAALTAAQQKEG